MSQVYRALKKAGKEERGEQKDEPLFGILEEELIIPREEADLKSPVVDIERMEGPIKEEVSIAVAPADSFAEEQFRKLRTFLFRQSPHPPRTILITSAAPREGKTMVAINLAMAISQEIHKRVILIDADLRKTSIYYGGNNNSKGLSSYLLNEATLKELLVNHGSKNFVVIPAGAHSQKAAELIGSKKMRDLLKDLREFGEDNYVLIDSPPVLSTSEPLLLSEWVDGVILVVMAGQVPRGTLRRVVDSIGKQKIIGIVFNQKDLKRSKNYPGYYYGYSKE